MAGLQVLSLQGLLLPVLSDFNIRVPRRFAHRPDLRSRMKISAHSRRASPNTSSSSQIRSPPSSGGHQIADGRSGSRVIFELVHLNPGQVSLVCASTRAIRLPIGTARCSFRYTGNSLQPRYCSAATRRPHARKRARPPRTQEEARPGRQRRRRAAAASAPTSRRVSTQHRARNRPSCSSVIMLSTQRHPSATLQLRAAPRASRRVGAYGSPCAASSMSAMDDAASICP